MERRLAIVEVPLGHGADEHIVGQKNQVAACGRHVAASPAHQSATGLDRESPHASPRECGLDTSVNHPEDGHDLLGIGPPDDV